MVCYVPPFNPFNGKYIADHYIPKGDYIMYKRIWGAAAALMLVTGMLSGCQTANETPALMSDNPASVVSSFSSQHPSTSSSKPKPESSSVSTVTPEFKERLDGYEDFFNEYIKFLTDYNKASDRTEMVSKLADYDARREDIANKLNSIDKSALSKADALYYDDVKYRISKKLDSIDKMYPSSASSGETSTNNISIPDPPKPPEKPLPPFFPSNATRTSSSSDSPSSSSSSNNPSSSNLPNSSSNSSSPNSVPESSSSASSQPSIAPPIDVTPPDTSSLMTDYTRKWGYNQLNSQQKTAYARLYESAEKNIGEFGVEDLNLNTNDADIIYWAFDYDNAQFLTLGSGYNYKYMDNGKVVEIGIQYGRSPSDVSTSQFTSRTQSVINEAEQLGNDYDRLKYIHDWIVNNTSYNQNGPLYKSEADGPVIYGSALCEGYSKAFMYMAQAMGYECVCIAGESGGGPHMWNMVKLGGSWYHIDVTWDDPISNSGPILRYDYFLVSDSTIRADHTINNPFVVPSAPSNYQ